LARSSKPAGLDGEGADRAIIVVAAKRVVFGHCLRDQVPDFTINPATGAARRRVFPLSAIRNTACRPSPEIISSDD